MAKPAKTPPVTAPATPHASTTPRRTMLATEPKRVTMQHIADKAGVTRATVSLALRSHPSIPDPTRLRITQIATNLGYSPNPMISALMADLRAKNASLRTSIIAYVTDATPEMMNRLPAAGRYYSGACRRAEELGYHVEYFHYPSATDARSLGRVLMARGIRGVLIAPGLSPEFSLTFNWSCFCAATLGYTLRNPVLNRSVNHQHHTLRLAFHKMLEKGRARIGLLITQADDMRVENAWTGGYLASQQAWISDSRRRIPFCYLDKTTPAALTRWFARHRPDVIIALREPPVSALRLAGIEPFRDVDVVLLDRSGDQPHVSGVDQRPDVVGEMGIDLIVQDLINNASGLPRSPKTVLTEGVWVDADTATTSFTPPEISRPSSKSTLSSL
ncbi:LacI family DNA-binding transcriptional regulator [Geminisphaera colitermitum]|uniref:LacI family DNA-binding transcriptional regulator n=1 Tax=Geminisphaera colitermitum TaxID=1148786 RepID=UPI000158CCEC|nr:LacI family DNA-binding transcriptional regulator [Geminisphaera colitermitum]